MKSIFFQIQKFFSSVLNGSFVAAVSAALKKERKQMAAFIVFSFLLVVVGQMIAVVGARQIIEPVTILANGSGGEELSSFKRFMQLARAGNYSLITPGKVPEQQWQVPGVFIKKIIIGISEADFLNLDSLDILIGGQFFHVKRQQLIDEWVPFNKAVIESYLNNEDLDKYVVLEAPAAISLHRSKIPVYKDFFGSLINWGGDDKVFLQPLARAVGITALLVIASFIIRIIFIWASREDSSVQISPEQTRMAKREFVVFFCAMLSAVTIIILINIFIYLVYKPDVGRILQDALARYVNYFFKSFQPKPVERMQFVVSVVMAPLVLLGCYYWCNKKISQTQEFVNHWYRRSVGAFIFLSASIVYLGLAISGFFYIRDSYYVSTIGMYVFNLLLFPVISVIFFIKKPELSKLVLYFLYTLIAATLIVVFFANIINLSDSFLTYTFDPVFYPVSQVMAGKNLLVQVSSLYGLFPLFLQPLFALIGLSVLKFSVVMAVLVVLSLLCLYQALTRLVVNKLFLLTGFLMIVFYSVLATRVIPENYFQYWPIRYVFPCLGILLTTVYFKNKHRLVYYSSFILYALGVLWNFDVGIVVFLSWILVLVYSELGAIQSRRAAFFRAGKHMVVAGLVFVLVMTSFAIWTRLRAGMWPDISLFTQYQKMFLSGYLMVKMLPPPHTWNIVILIYLAGLLISVRAVLKQKIRYIENLILFLSVLGIGLFSYYEGQSLDVALFRTSYPALILIVIFADRLWERLKMYRYRLYGETIIFIFLFYFLISVPFSILYNMRTYLNFIQIGANFFTVRNSVYFNDLKFIKQYTQPGEDVFILSLYNQGIYYGGSQTGSVVNVPSITDAAFPREIETIIQFLKTNRKTKVFVQKPLDQYDVFDSRIKKIIQEKYIEANENQSGLVFYIVK